MLLGRNGAGKTTTPAHDHGPVAGVAGHDRLRRRSDITGRDTPDIARAGIAYVPESMGIFADLTVKENMVLAARARRDARRQRAWSGSSACSRR